MKICFFISEKIPHFTLKWVEYFVKRNHDVHIISFEKMEIENVTIHYVGPPIYIYGFSIIFSLIAKLKTIRKIIKEINPDIVHGHYVIKDGFYAAATGFKPLIISAWGSDVLLAPKKYILFKFIMKYTLRKSDIIHIESEIMKKEIEKYNKHCDIKIIPWGVDINMFNQTAYDKINIEKLKEKLLLDSSLIIVSTRAFRPIYDIETLIRAIPYVIEKVPNPKFILKTYETTEINKYKEKLIKLATDLNVSEHIRFVGHTEYREIPIYLNCADIYVSTSLSDSCSISMLEAMACGLPVVVSDEPSNLEWIKDGYNGYIFPRKNYKVLAEKLIILLNDKEKREIFGSRNRKIIEEKGDWNKNMEKVEKIYENLINKYKYGLEK